MGDDVNALAYVREDAARDVVTTCDFAKKQWTSESYSSVPAMWVQPETVMSLEHAVFPLLQISLFLSSSEMINDFGCRLNDSAHDAMRTAICASH
jgi:hypothetical protein